VGIQGAGVDDLEGDLFHSVRGLAVLLVPLVLNIYKPRGLTRYGWRAQQRQRDEVGEAGGTEPRR